MSEIQREEATVNDWLGYSELNLVLCLLGAIIIVYTLISEYLKRLWLNDTIIAMVVGIIFSEPVSGIINVNDWFRGSGVNDITIIEETARIVISIQLVATGLKLPPRYFRRNWKSQAVLLGLILPITWGVSGLLAWLFLNTVTDLNVGFWESMLIGATVSPTDPVLAAAVVTGRFAESHLTENIRQTLSAESGANDGLGFPVVLLPLYLLARDSVGSAMWWWVVQGVIYQVIVGIIVGAIVGYICGRALMWSEKKKAFDIKSFFGYSVGISIFVLGGGRLLGLDEILSSFVAGIVFSNVVIREDIENIQDAVDEIFTISFMFLFGLVLPWSRWWDAGWSGVLTTVTILLLRRLPFVMLVKPILPSAKRYLDAFMIGWFGPVGVAALFYNAFATKILGNDIFWVIGSEIVFASTILFGVTATPFAIIFKKFSKKELEKDKQEAPEDVMIGEEGPLSLLRHRKHNVPFPKSPPPPPPVLKSTNFLDKFQSANEKAISGGPSRTSIDMPPLPSEWKATVNGEVDPNP